MADEIFLALDEAGVDLEGLFLEDCGGVEVAARFVTIYPSSSTNDDTGSSV